MNSLDPRVNRLPAMSDTTTAAANQLITFEVFVQPKEGKPFQHEGAVHASDVEMAYVLAKEAFTRRFTCSSLYVVETKKIVVTRYTDGNVNAYDFVDEIPAEEKEERTFEIYHLLKRGKQHIHAGTIKATSEGTAFRIARQTMMPDKPVYNVWCVATDQIRFTHEDEKDLWTTLPEKKFRDASDYKGGDKLKTFLERNAINRS